MNRFLSYLFCKPRSACRHGEFCEHHFEKTLLRHDSFITPLAPAYRESSHSLSYDQAFGRTRREAPESDDSNVVSDVIAAVEVAEAVSDLFSADSSDSSSSPPDDYSGGGGDFGGGGASGDW